MNKLFTDAVRKGSEVNFDNLKKAYITALWDSVNFYNRLAIKALNRSPRHILLLHENDLAAMFVDDLANFFRKKGWKIISAREAYEDSLSKMVPDTLRNGNGRVAAIASSKGFSNEETRDKYQSKEAVEKLFKEMKVFDGSTLNNL